MKKNPEKTDKRKRLRSEANSNKASANQSATGKLPELPPNENLKKFPDEAYGDTQIPARDRNL